MVSVSADYAADYSKEPELHYQARVLAAKTAVLLLDENLPLEFRFRHAVALASLPWQDFCTDTITEEWIAALVKMSDKITGLVWEPEADQ